MELPPAVKIILDEKLGKGMSPKTLKEAIARRGLEKELRAQANWSVDHFLFADSGDVLATGVFGVTPTGALNPFSPVGKCQQPDCVAQSTDDFIKTVGLYSDFAVVPDPITRYFVGEDSLPDGAYGDLLRDLYVLGQVSPLVKAGVLQFGKPIRYYCEHCDREVLKRMHDATESLFSQAIDYEAELEVGPDESILALRMPVYYPDQNHPLIYGARLDESAVATLGAIAPSGQPMTQEGRDLVRKIIEDCVKGSVQNLFIELDTSRKTQSLLLAGSRVETLVISQLDGAAISLQEIEHWERLRTVHLPWIHELTTDEVLRLRQEADKALPRLRELFRKRLSEPSADPSKQIAGTVAELRSEAIEVQDELDALGLPKERNYRAGMAGLAMAVVIYGLASQVPAVEATSLAALLATLAHLRERESKLDKQEADLLATPSYALLKARQLLNER